MTRPGTFGRRLFFDHEKGKLGLFELMDVKERAASILGGKTDIMTRNSLHPRLKKRTVEAGFEQNWEKRWLVERAIVREASGAALVDGVDA